MKPHSMDTCIMNQNTGDAGDRGKLGGAYLFSKALLVNR